MPLAGILIHKKGQNRRQQKRQRDHRPHLEVLHSNDFFINISGQNIIVATNNFWHPEICENLRENDKGGANNAVPRARDRNRQKRSKFAGVQHICSLIQARI